MSKSTEETSNAKVGKSVVTEKQKYFVPSIGTEVEAVDQEDIEKQAKKAREMQEDGDGNS